jgi:dihydropteroate synthase
VNALQLCGRRLPLGARTLVMGIVNNTPDSFYDRGRHAGVEAAVAHARSLMVSGADLVDVGGQTGRMGEEIPAAEEAARIVPVIEALAGLCVSVDTYRAEVAEAALAAGAGMVNDYTGGHDPELAAVAGASAAALVVTHYRGRPRSNPSRSYDATVDDVLRELEPRIEHALGSGVAPDALLVDPGFGFGKSTRLDLQLLRDLDRIRALGFPLLVAPSHKEFTADATGTSEDDLRGTAAAVAIACRAGADMVRIHDVAELMPAIRLADAVRRGDA